MLTAKRFGSLTLAVLAAAGADALAQEPGPIVTKRPGFSFSPTTVGLSTLQIESGYLYVSDDSGTGFDAQSLPLLLFRYGVAEDIEVQFGWGGYAWAEAGDVERDGATDANVAVKWQVSDDDAAVPLALYAGFNLPIGASAFSSDESDPAIGAFWSYSAGLDWFGTVIVNNLDSTAVINNAVGINLPINDRFGSFVEYYGVFGDGGPEHYLNGGVTWLPENNLQWDSYLGLGLNDRAIDVSFNLGLSYRY